MRKRHGKTQRRSAPEAPEAQGGAAEAALLAPAAEAGTELEAPHGRRRAVAAAFIGIALLAPVFALICGFAVFVARSMQIEPPPASVKSDAIIVLTGGRARLETGFALLRAGRGGRLLISGVSPVIRGRHNFAQILGAEPALLECCVDLGWQALNTSGNALESADWVAKRGYRTVLIVTNRYHMLRSLAELRHKMPQAELIPYPVEQAGGLFQSAENFRLFASEYGKFLVVRLRNLFS